MSKVNSQTVGNPFMGAGGSGSSVNNQIKNAAKKLGDKLTTAETNFIKEVKGGDQGKIAEAQQELQKWQRAFTAFSEVMRSMHEMMMTIIRSLRV